MFDLFNTNLFNIGIKIIYQNNNNVCTENYKKEYILKNLVTLKILLC